MAVPLEFPYDTLKPSAHRLDILGQTVTGGLSQSGQQQRVNATGGGLWGLQLDFNTLRKVEQIKAWNRIRYRSHGGVVPVNVSICELRFAPRAGVPHSDGTPFSDFSLYRWYGAGASLTANAALRATTATMNFEGGADPTDGGFFFSMSYGDGRHELHFVEYAVASGDDYIVTFIPPLRAAHTIGDDVELAHPKCTYVLAQPDAMSISIRNARFGEGPAAAFVEYLGA